MKTLTPIAALRGTILSAAVLSLIGCVNDKPSSGAAKPDVSLTETYWKVESIAGKPTVVLDGYRETHFILRSKDNRVNTHGGVNGMGGTYTLAGNRLTFGPLIGTKMAGPDALNAQEAAFSDAMSKVNEYAIVGDTLTLSRDGTTLMVLKAVAL